jgi:hypothetical protein
LSTLQRLSLPDRSQSTDGRLQDHTETGRPHERFKTADYARDAINRNDSSPLDVHVNAGVRGNASPKPWPIWRLCVEVTLSLG